MDNRDLGPDLRHGPQGGFNAPKGFRPHDLIRVGQGEPPARAGLLQMGVEGRMKAHRA